MLQEMLLSYTRKQILQHSVTKTDRFYFGIQDREKFNYFNCRILIQFLLCGECHVLIPKDRDILGSSIRNILSLFRCLRHSKIGKYSVEADYLSRMRKRYESVGSQSTCCGVYAVRFSPSPAKILLTDLLLNAPCHDTFTNKSIHSCACITAET